MSTELVNLQPIVVPPQQEKVYDLLWMKSLTISAQDTTSIRLVGEFLPYRKLEDGTGEIMPVDPLNPITNIMKEKEITWANAMTNQKFVQAYLALMDVVKTEFEL
jgi:hypothetical protein